MTLFLFIHPPEKSSVQVGLRVAAGCAAAEEVLLFFAGEGVRCLDAGKGGEESQELVQELVQIGAKVAYCQEDAARFEVTVPPWAEGSSLVLLGRTFQKCERVVSF